MSLKYKLIVFEIFLLISCTFSYFGTVLDDDCFCQVSQDNTTYSVVINENKIFLSCMEK